jgi:hypothetical protein
MKFKKMKHQLYTDDFWYDLTDGGYIHPKDILEDQKDIDKINNALSLIERFKSECFHEGIIEEM